VPEAEFRTIEPKIPYFGTPVALISSLNEDGTTNLAPMSSFWALGAEKPISSEQSPRFTARPATFRSNLGGRIRNIWSKVWEGSVGRKLKPFGWDCRIVGRSWEGRNDDERRNERFARSGGRVSSGSAALGDRKYFHGAARNSRRVAAAAIYFSDVRVPEGRRVHAETYSGCGWVVQGAKSECDDAADDDRFRGYSVIGAGDLDGGDGAGRKAQLRGLLFTDESVFGEAA